MALRELEEAIRALQKRQGDLQGAFSNLPILRGTTAQRNAAYGVPTTTAQHVALANQKVTFYNTDTGWEESYYAVTGSAGLTARGLITGTAPGWYPTGAGPWCIMQPSAAKSVTSDTYLGGWNGTVRRNGGAAWFNPTATVIQVQKAGLYDFGYWTNQQNGSGIANYYLRILNSAGTVVDAYVDGGGFALNGSFASKVHHSVEAYPLTAGQQIAPHIASGSLQVHFVGNVRGQLYARYVGPALVTD